MPQVFISATNQERNNLQMMHLRGSAYNLNSEFINPEVRNSCLSALGKCYTLFSGDKRETKSLRTFLQHLRVNLLQGPRMGSCSPGKCWQGQGTFLPPKGRGALRREEEQGQKAGSWLSCFLSPWHTQARVQTSGVAPYRKFPSNKTRSTRGERSHIFREVTLSSACHFPEQGQKAER